MYLVVMNDKFMSGWGRADGKINTLIFLCENYVQACNVERTAEKRTDMNHIRITHNFQKFNCEKIKQLLQKGISELDYKNRLIQIFDNSGSYSRWYI